MVVGIVVVIITLALVVGLLSLIVAAARRRGAGGGGVDAHSVRRFFQYLLLYALFVVAAVGLTELLGRMLGAASDPWEDDAYLLAQALAFALVGLPLAGALAWWTWRGHRGDTSEAGSTLFTAYLTLAALTGLVAGATSLQAVVTVALDEARLDPDAAAGVLVWGALWAGHWVAARRALDPERGAPHLLLGSLVGLVLLVSGLVTTLGSALDLVLRADVPDRPTGALAEGAGLAVAGVAVWTLYWLATALRLPRRTPWLAYVLPVGVGGGLVMALVAASRLLWSVAVWLVGDRLGRSASEHFESAAFEVAALALGVLVWRYHKTVLGAAAAAGAGEAAGRGEVLRVYEYLVAGIALVAAAVGIGTLLVALIEATTPGSDEGMTVLNTLLAAVTLLLVGLPVWWLFWGRIRAAVAAEPAPEAMSLTRRVYLVVLFGVAGIVAVVALIVVAFTFFQDLVNAQSGPGTLRAMRYGLGVLVGTAAASTYHGLVFRRDRTLVATGPAAGPRSVLLIGAADRDVERAVRATGARVEAWGRLDSTPAPWDEAALVATLAGHAGEDVVVVAEASGPRVIVVDLAGRPTAPR